MLNDDARAERLATGRGLPLRFIEQATLPAGVAYETHIAETGAVPTRHNLHDFFNALVWFAYPRIKAALNARQAAAIDAAGVGSARGGVRDALTLFDESGALFATSDPALAAALRGFDWPTLMRASRDAWGSRCDARIVGHALAEKLVDPYKGCAAHAWIVDVPAAFFVWRVVHLRAWLAERVAAAEPRLRAAAGARRARLVAGERITVFLRRSAGVSQRPTCARGVTRAGAFQPATRACAGVRSARIVAAGKAVAASGRRSAVLESCSQSRLGSRGLRGSPRRARKVRTPTGQGDG